jgi:Flp pilus assembly protein TadG
MGVLNMKLIRKHLQRSQRGQSILLLAFGFIALISFVGLVTDISLLYVRYAALRRAVDSAAIAAAGQIREGTDYGEVSVAAQQYIELHGLDPSSVIVETCETDILAWRSGTGPWAGSPHPESAAYPAPVSSTMPETELCDWNDPHKLVRVSAQVSSPTTFLSLIGIKAITLEATSVSETAVLDIALVIDTSESMTNVTWIENYEYQGIDTDPTHTGPLAIRPECVSLAGETAGTRERWAGCCNDPGTGNVGDGSRQNNGLIVPNGQIWHDTNSNGMYDGAYENGLASTVAQGDYSTLICQPFKQVKDAARLFIKRLDFTRGDRVVLVTFDRAGIPYDPDGTTGPLRPLMRSEALAIQTLNERIGVQVNSSGKYNKCDRQNVADADWTAWLAGTRTTRPDMRPNAYETLASCGNTNVGGGILAANDAITDPIDIRREAVWVMIILTDGAANVTNSVGGVTNSNEYGYWGYCPWWTFCCAPGSTGSGCGTGEYVWSECTARSPYNNPTQVERALPLCNDNDPNSRHFCLSWVTGLPDPSNIECTEQGHYDADDYARDMSDFASLVEVATGHPGNFIAAFSIGFGEDVATDPTGAPLLRYIADAGDNGFIDNNLQQDWRDNGVQNYPVGGPYPASFGDPDPCENVTDPYEQCGQYFYAHDFNTLTDVFEQIASRLFTRISR